MTFSVRRAGGTEGSILTAIEEDAAALFSDAPGLDWLADQPGRNASDYTVLIDGGAVWVAVSGGAPVGFLAAQRAEGALHIVELSVRRAFQRQGIARCLIMEAVIEARRLRLDALTLTTFRHLPWNAPFYESAGFVALGPGEVGHRLTEILADEAAAGLPATLRCAMMKPICAALDG